MIHEVVFFGAVVWMTVLLGAGVVLAIRAKEAPRRILALDMITLILVAALVLFGQFEGNGLYLDAALLLAILSFVATVAAARYHAEGKVF